MVLVHFFAKLQKRIFSTSACCLQNSGPPSLLGMRIVCFNTLNIYFTDGQAEQASGVQDHDGRDGRQHGHGGPWAGEGRGQVRGEPDLHEPDLQGHQPHDDLHKVPPEHPAQGGKAD